MWRRVLIIFAVFSAAASGGRTRRHLVFNKGSRLFFSVNVRDNLFIHSDLFANVVGFKIDWDLPASIVNEPKKGRVQRRDLYQGIETFFYRHEFNGTSCVRKFLCEASNDLSNSDLFLAQLYELIFAVKEREILSTYNISDVEKDCRDILTANSEGCPFSLSSMVQESRPGFKLAL